MGKTSTITGTIDHDVYNVSFTIKIRSGVHTLPNGDPGYPDESGIIIHSITTHDEFGTEVEVDELELDSKVVESIYSKINEYTD